MGFAESHAAAVKHTVITIDKTRGRIKRCLQLTTVLAAKRAAVHAEAGKRAAKKAKAKRISPGTQGGAGG